MTAASDNTQELLEQLSTLLNREQPERTFDVGAKLHALGERAAALAAFEAETERAPESLAAWHALVALRLELNLPQAALQACNRALEIDPKNPDTLYNTAFVLQAIGDFGAALHCYDKVLEQNPAHYRTMRNRPHMLAHMGQRTEAFAAVDIAIANYPDDALLHYNKGDLRLGGSDGGIAIRSFETALALEPKLHQARYAMSIALALEGDLSAAYRERNAALQQQPGLETSYQSPLVHDIWMGSSDCRPERVAVTAIVAALHACNWSAYEKGTQFFSELVVGTEHSAPLTSVEFPYTLLLFPSAPEIRRQMARQVMATLEGSVRHHRLTRPRRSRDSSQPLTIAYFSADFKPHVMTWLLGSMYAKHDRKRFRVLAYSTSPAGASAEQAQVAAGVDVFYDLHHHPAEAIAQLMVRDGVDILVDLSGYTMDAKPAVLALRPAPIQVSYLGFLGTMGTKHIDYALLDRDSMLPAQREYWDESIVALPATSIYCERHVTEAETLGRHEYGLLEAGFVLCALHMPRKIDPLAFDVWLALLEEIPGSVLWLVQETAEQAQALRARAGDRGVDPSRLVFAPLLPRQEHLARYRLADVFLDTFVFNGHTTVIDALSMGVPVVSMPGETPCARGAASILRSHGLGELVASSREDYKRIVHRLRDDAEWRRNIRETVATDAGSRLFCPDQRVREIETAYEMMWARHQAGLPPADFDVPEWNPAA